MTASLDSERPANDLFAAIRGRFQSRCHRDLALVRKAMTERDTPGGGDFHTAIHKLAGLAGTFGYARLGGLAAALDARLVAGDGPSYDELRMLEAALEQVATAP